MSGHTFDVVYSGPEHGETALILIHGRGSSPEDILSLAAEMPLENPCIAAPRATNNTWYPGSFLLPVQQNEPWLSTAIEVLGKTVDELVHSGYREADIHICGFSQGACLALEFAGRRGAAFAGVWAFSGGLIGAQIDASNYAKALNGLPVFIGCSTQDPHVPEKRVLESEQLFNALGARAQAIIYPNMGHTITRAEIADAAEHVLRIK